MDINSILNFEYNFSLKDYTTYKIYNCSTSSKNVNNSLVRVFFPFRNKTKEIIENRNNLKNRLAFFKNYLSDNNNIKMNYRPLYKKLY